MCAYSVFSHVPYAISFNIGKMLEGFYLLDLLFSFLDYCCQAHLPRSLCCTRQAFSALQQKKKLVKQVLTKTK